MNATGNGHGHGADGARDVLRAFDLTGLPMCVLGLDGRCVRVSQGLAEMVGTTPATLVGSDVLEVVHPEDRDRLVAMRDLMCRGAFERPKFRMRLVRAGVRTVPAVVRASLIRGGDGIPACFLLVVDDEPDERQVPSP